MEWINRLMNQWDSLVGTGYTSVGEIPYSVYISDANGT